MATAPADNTPKSFSGTHENSHRKDSTRKTRYEYRGTYWELQGKIH